MIDPRASIRISVVICTRNRVDKLCRALEAVGGVTLSWTWELIVVDNASTDGTASFLKEFRPTNQIGFKVIHEEKPGLSNARNAGWRVARGEFVAFTDDDCYPARNWLQELCVCFDEADIAFLGGRVLLHDSRDYPITIQELERRVEIAPRSFVEPGLIHGANLAFRRVVLEKIGGFDPLFGAGALLVSGEDCEALARASFSGYRGAYDPRPIVSHDHGRRTRSEVRGLYVGYDIGRGAYYAKGFLDARMRSAFLRAWAAALWRELRKLNVLGIGRQFRGIVRYVRHM